MLTLSELKRTRADLETEYQSAVEAIDICIAVWERREGVAPEARTPNPTPTPVLVTQRRSYGAYEIELHSIIKNDHADVPYTSRWAYEALASRQVVIPGRDPDSQVNTVLNALHRMVDDGMLEVKSAGLGRRPTVFVRAERTEETPAEAGA